MPIFSRFYQPYLFHNSPDHCYYHRSVHDNPLFGHFEAVTRKATQALQRLRAKRVNGEVTEDEKFYYNRDWFLRMSSELDVLIERVRIERLVGGNRVQSGTIQHRTLFLYYALLEVACSLLLHCDDNRYTELSDVSVQDIRFLLSRWSRETIRSLRITNDGNITVYGYF